MAKTKKIKKLKCQGKCKREISESNFYISKSTTFKATGRSPICKKCIKDMIDLNDMKTVYSVLKTLDVPFLVEYWYKALECKGETFGNYIRMANSLPQISAMTYEDSVFELNVKKKLNENEIQYQSVNRDDLLDGDERDELLYKWGFGYSDEELYSFERKFNLLKNNYPQRTAMHTEALQTYIRYRVKEELATADGNVSEADKWGKLAEKASDRAKINPSQLSQSDLSGGLNTFGELVRMVERAVDVVEVLPEFKERENDKIDFTLLCYINYVRRLKNLPDATHEEVYAFYEERKKEYSTRVSSGEAKDIGLGSDKDGK